MKMISFLIILLLTNVIQLESTIHVIGDSHSQEFSCIDDCIIHYLGPRTMHRVGRDGLDILNFQNLGIQENDIVILAFGEIDVRCHVGKQRDIHNRDLEEVINTLCENYFTTILKNKAYYNNLRVACYTVTPPIPEVLNPEYESYGSIEDRVMISKKLNEKLIELSAAFNVDVLDVYKDYADDCGVLIPKLSDGSVHINPSCNVPIKIKLEALYPLF